jgi:hypothetical protein
MQRIVPLDSTTTVLADAATYTGTKFSTQYYGRLVGTCISDHAGTMYIDQSPDGEHWDYSSSFTLSAATGIAVSVEVIAPWARLRIINGSGAAQTYLRAFVSGRVMS